MSKMTGGCHCAAIRYEVDTAPVFVGHCQCSDCKKSTGAGHATAAAFPEAAVRMTGTLKEYASKTDSGSTATRGFCPDCGGRLTFRSTNMPGMLLVLAGSLDDPGLIAPTVALYNKRHVAWDVLDPSLHVTEAMPPAP